MKYFAVLPLFVNFFLMLFANAQDGSSLASIKIQQLHGSQPDSSKIILALDFKHQPKWHTYWKNPGNAGLATQFQLSLLGETQPQQVTQKAWKVHWPPPQHFQESADIETYGYSDQQLFFVELSPEKIKTDRQYQLSLNWLICKDICIPGSGSVEFQITKEASGYQIQIPKQYLSPLPKDRISKAWDQIPTISNIKNNEIHVFVHRDVKSDLSVQIVLLNYPRELIESDNYNVFPINFLPLDMGREKKYYDANNKILYVSFSADWDGVYQNPPMELPTDGRFKQALSFNFLVKNQKGKWIETSTLIDTITPTTDTQLQKLYEGLENVSLGGNQNDSSQNDNSKSREKTFSLPLLLLFAFIGGLILNFMPCVLPVISLKLFGLIQQKDLPRRALVMHNLSYSLGVLMSFWVLALIILSLKWSGESVGWGFQLQSPLFVTSMIFVIFALALNFFGLYEFQTPGGKWLGNVKLTESQGGALLTGVLATILSTPCSAPFLGTALTFAFVSSEVITFLVFTLIALGLAAPFLMTAIFPKAIHIMPSPGMWMVKVKWIMGLFLILTCLWLFDVLLTITSYQVVPYLLLSMTLLFFGLFVRKHTAKWGWMVSLGLVGALVTAKPIYEQLTSESQHLSNTSPHVSTGEKWEKFSVEKLNQYQEEGKKVFIDFTASWCLNCLVNKKLVLDRDSFYDFAKKEDIILMRADWSKHDPVITDFLNSYDIFGIPAYFLIQGQQVNFLGETISIKKVSRYLKSDH